MNPSNRSAAAFTLLELLVVLAILGIVTTLAVRSLDQVEDQHRYESTLRRLEEIEFAVLGSPDDRTADGARTLGGFVADMGRLPVASVSAAGAALELRELWENPGLPLFDVRPATAPHLTDVEHQDPAVLVPGGWRGPYLRLPLGAAGLLDGWGRAIATPLAPDPATLDGAGYGRLRDAADAPVTVGQPVGIVRVLGADGRLGPGGTGYDRDLNLLLAGRFGAAIHGQVDLEQADGPMPPNPENNVREVVVVRVFGPDPDNAAQIEVVHTEVPFTSNPVIFTIPPAPALTSGLRVVRAYLQPVGELATASALRRSTVRQVTLRPGMNLLNLVIDR
jgi:prepilin-type N-terminal cleavage/methylation domain-containing protein